MCMPSIIIYLGLLFKIEIISNSIMFFNIVSKIPAGMLAGPSGLVKQ